MAPKAVEKMKIVYRKIKELIPAKYNPRQLTDKQFKDLTASFEKLGTLEPAVINMARTRKNIVISGHQRLKVAESLGMVEYPCYEVEFSLKKEKEANIRMNKNTGEWDMDLLANNFEVEDLLDWGFEDLNFTGDPGGGLTDEDSVPDAPNKLKTRPGDLYQLGEHRLLCGDSTKIEDVERLMDGEKADMVFTDPPYGVDYDGGTTKREKLKGDDNTDLYEPCCKNAFAFTNEKAPLYLWHAGVKGIAAAAAAAAAAANFVIRCEIVWNKTLAQFGALSAQYKQKHEPCYYCYKKGKTVNWCGPKNEVTVWDVDRSQVNEYHPTQKPVALAERAITNHKAEMVLDFFGGSGSTLIACEKTSRKCRMMELDPIYCDVIVKRWEEYAGKKAKLIKA